MKKGFNIFSTETLAKSVLSKNKIRKKLIDTDVASWLKDKNNTIFLQKEYQVKSSYKHLIYQNLFTKDEIPYEIFKKSVM